MKGDKNTTKETPKQENLKTSDDIDSKLLFCALCLQYPEYSILIDESENIYLEHDCVNGKISINLSQLKDIQSSAYPKICESCKEPALNICAKCQKFICNNCLNVHEGASGFTKINYSEATIMKIIDYQYYCKKHFEKVTHYCNICKMNLCQNKCLETHYHCKNEVLDYKINIEPSNYKGDNKTLKSLALLAKAFKNCYNETSFKKKMTLNILLNSKLIEQINSFINNNKNKKNIKLVNIQIKNNQRIQKEENCVFNSFLDENFQIYYFKLITGIYIGQIDSYHDLLSIEEKYEKLKNTKKKVISFMQQYIFAMHLSIDKEFNLLSGLSWNREIIDIPLILLDTKNKLNKIQLLQSRLELDIDLLKKFVLSIDYRVDYELRRKIGNLIANKIVNLIDINKIDNFSITEYLLALSIEDIENTIIKVSSKNTSNYDKTMEDLKNVYYNGLNLMQKLIAKKLNGIKEPKLPKIEKPNTSIRFKNLKKVPSDIEESVIFNLFFIIKKKIGEYFNATIHNKPVTLNKLAKEALDKYEKEQEQKNSEDALKKEQNETQACSEINIDKKKPNLINSNTIKEIDGKNQNDFLFEKKICPKREIVLIKKNITIEDKIFEEKEDSLKKIKIVQKVANQASSLSEFYKHLKEKETKYFNIQDDLDIEAALNSFLTGKKNQSLVPLNKYYNQEDKENDNKKKIKMLLENSEQSESVEEINNFIAWLKNTINSNKTKLLYYYKNSLRNIEEYAAYFDISDTINKLQLTLPLNFEQIDNLKYKLSSSANVDYLEKLYYIIQIYIFLYCEKYIEFYEKLEIKIEQSGYKDIFLLNESKRILYKEARDRVESISINENGAIKIWDNLKKTKTFVDNPYLDKEIASYVNNNNFEKFVDDLSANCRKLFNGIDLRETDPQNIYLKPFMIQNKLYCEIK